MCWSLHGQMISGLDAECRAVLRLHAVLCRVFGRVHHCKADALHPVPRRHKPQLSGLDVRVFCHLEPRSRRDGGRCVTADSHHTRSDKHDVSLSSALYRSEVNRETFLVSALSLMFLIKLFEKFDEKCSYEFILSADSGVFGKPEQGLRTYWDLLWNSTLLGSFLFFLREKALLFLISLLSRRNNWDIKEVWDFFFVRNF